MNKEAHFKLTKARTHLVIKQPFYGTLALHLELVEDSVSCQGTIATDGRRIYYCPEWVLKQSPEQLKGVLVHELLHCVYLHMSRRQNRDPTRWNIAGDYAINLDILSAGFKLPEGGCVDQQYKGMSAEAIYAKLPKGAQGCPWGIILDAASSSDGAAISAVSNDWQVKVQQALAVAGSKGIGSLPADLKRLMDRLNKPVIDWRTELRRFIDQHINVDVTWSNPNKRLLHTGIVMPGNLKGGVEKVGNVIDTSGSIPAKALQQFYAELEDILDNGQVKEMVMFSCDAKVHEPIYRYQAGDSIDPELAGGGGTRFSPAIRWYTENEPDIAVMIYFTDLLCSDFGPEPEYPVLWVVWGNERDLDRVIAPFGEIIKLREN